MSKELKFGTDSLVPSKRSNFVGEIVEAIYPEKSEEYDTEQLHLVMKPLKTLGDREYKKEQHEWLNPDVTDPNSKWGEFNKALKELDALPNKVGDLVGRVFEFESVELKVGFNRDTVVNLWKPIRIVGGVETTELKRTGKSSEPIV